MSHPSNDEIIATEPHAPDSTSSKARRISYDPTLPWDWREGHDAVPQLEVLDVPFDGQSPIRVLDLSNTAQLDTSQLCGVLSSLLPPATAMARVFVSIYPSKVGEREKESQIRIALQKYFNLAYNLQDSDLAEQWDGNDPQSIISQWVQSPTANSSRRSQLRCLASSSIIYGYWNDLRTTNNFTFSCWKHSDNNLIGMFSWADICETTLTGPYSVYRFQGAMGFTGSGFPDANTLL